MSKQDIQEARELGQLSTDVKYIRESIDEIKKSIKINRIDIDGLKEFKTRQSAYYVAATFVGGMIVFAVDYVIKYFNRG